MSIDFWQEVTIPTEGIEARDTDALECLLALCRGVGLNYQIKKVDEGYLVKVAWKNWPTDFFRPCERDGSFSMVGPPDSNPADLLRSAIMGAIYILLRNANMFSLLFRQEYREKTGETWGSRKDKKEINVMTNQDLFNDKEIVDQITQSVADALRRAI